MSTGKPVLNASTQTLDCGGCGTHETIILPMDLGDFGKKLEAFAREHIDCETRYAAERRGPC